MTDERATPPAHVIDLLYVVHNRAEFTRRTLELLIENTDWFLVNRLYLYDDNSTDGAGELLDAAAHRILPYFDGRDDGFQKYIFIRRGAFGGPVAIMNHFLDLAKPIYFAKVDNDTAVPPAWLNVLWATMKENPTLDLLGMEPILLEKSEPACTDQEWDQAYKGNWIDGIPARKIEPCSHIGGIGLMRGGAFLGGDRPQPGGDNGRFGFTAWQYRCNVTRAWLSPPLPVALLDRMPIEPWVSLSEQYENKGWQREWPKYTEDARHIWGWLDQQKESRMFVMTATCKKGHHQVVLYDEHFGRDWVETQAGLIDGSSPLYKFKPGAESTIGKCAWMDQEGAQACGAQIKCEVNDLSKAEALAIHQV
jgi:hypothetical protein